MVAVISRDEAVAEIYAAAVEPDGLSQIAGVLRRYVDVDSVGVWFLDKGEVTGIAVTDDIEASTRPYLDYYRALDPWAAQLKAPGLVYLACDGVREEQLVRGEFYQDFARRYGMLRPMGLACELDRGRLGTFALNRTSSAKLLGETERAVLQDLAPHLRGALMLRGRVLAERAAGEARAAALDALSFGVAICDGQGVILELNEAAYGLLRADRGLRSAGLGGVLRARGAPEAAFAAAIEAAAAGEPGALRLCGSDGAGLSALLTPAGGPSFGAGRGARAVLVYLATDDGAPAAVDPQTLARLFGLSATQAQLCVQLAAGLTFEEAAAERGVATSTARSHFATVLDRTGASNLRDLLRLLGSLPPVRR